VVTGELFAIDLEDERAFEVKGFSPVPSEIRILSGSVALASNVPEGFSVPKRSAFRYPVNDLIGILPCSCVCATRYFGKRKIKKTGQNLGVGLTKMTF